MSGPKKQGGLPRLGPHTMLRVLIPNKLLAQIDAITRNRSEWVRAGIEAALKNLRTQPVEAKKDEKDTKKIVCNKKKKGGKVEK